MLLFFYLFRYQFERLPMFRQANHALATPIPLLAAPSPNQFPAHQMQLPSETVPRGFQHSVPLQTFQFSQEQLDMILYGYTKNSDTKTPNTAGHAISGLRIGNLSHGQ